MFKLLWFAIKNSILIPIIMVTLYFGLLQPVSKRLSLMELSENMTSGTTAFSAFGDFTAERMTIYRAYYNIWIPKEHHIKPIKKEKPEAI